MVVVFLSYNPWARYPKIMYERAFRAVKSTYKV